jgi:hypothetical protein
MSWPDQEAEELDAKIGRLETQVAMLRAALKPFAEQKVEGMCGTDDLGLTREHFLEAQRAYEQTAGENR